MSGRSLTLDAERGLRLARRHPDVVCPGCGRRAGDHPPGAWGTCTCGRLIHRYGPGGIARCRVCREQCGTGRVPEAS